ncbi:MAG: ferredoxin [archaeon]|nr:MAG: ferredoxin [archaeon]
MAKYKVVQQLDKCIGCGACAAVCPENWVMKDNKAHPKKKEISDKELEPNKDAEDACPVKCIQVKKA